jgi:hypothetical protein
MSYVRNSLSSFVGYFAMLPLARLQNLEWQDDKLESIWKKVIVVNQNTAPAFA